tara:strand:- start:2388 stop:2699 length:312 start_codon:yes stop_codon:yes gene_type:complete
MKKLIALMVLSTALTANSAEKFAEIIKGTTITLTTLLCTMYESPPDIMLFQAHAEDLVINQQAEGCYSVTADGNVVINLVNIVNHNQYGYVLPQDIFEDRVYF